MKVQVSPVHEKAGISGSLDSAIVNFLVTFVTSSSKVKLNFTFL